ncbi:gamma-glutamylcyclotransferase family protein [Mucilaginibacter flavidus]|uniref:gamma-glutamylcyclotransferase family protein n=1 Tax=Mucilaginibacter flavidus TaxID=2949309 RepID=UPI0020934A8A|nr:gamma-glutamylcyclotransferase family protein [Mucilaginibacter flavidus]MCO5947720.1 gamma-glutamylcyclotransferase [Mucilaginibacter flavidus]
MKNESAYLFVYGTLLDKQNEFGAYLNANCTFYADGKFKGRLYDMGEYPGAVIDNKGRSYVHGKIYQLINTKQVFKQLDHYEAFGPKEAQPNLFVRELVSVEAADTTVECWVYLYNLPVDEYWLIESGVYSGNR